MNSLPSRKLESISGVPAQTPLTKNERALKLLFGATIRQYRQQLGLTQEALAKRADMHRTYVADAERGARNLALTNVARLTKALDVPLAAFFAKMEKIEPTVVPRRR